MGNNQEAKEQAIEKMLQEAENICANAVSHVGAANYAERENEAHEWVEAAMSKVQNASTLIHDFGKSKPLNILYKELRASEMLLNYYTGVAKTLPQEGYEIATPQSIKAFFNLNDKVSPPVKG